MSTGLECEFYETKGEWFYLLQDWDCPRQCWDWREHATAYGPFTSEEKADEHLRANHANPGGSCTTQLGDQPLDEVLTKAFDEARKRPAPRRTSFGWGRY